MAGLHVLCMVKAAIQQYHFIFLYFYHSCFVDIDIDFFVLFNKVKQCENHTRYSMNMRESMTVKTRY